MKTVNSDDYAAQEYFKNPELEYITSEYRSHGECVFCGGDLLSVSCYHFKNKKTGEEIAVRVSASYGICGTCGAI